MQVDDSSPDQSSKADSSALSCSTNKTKGQCNQPRFELTSTVYAAPFSLPSIGKRHQRATNPKIRPVTAVKHPFLHDLGCFHVLLAWLVAQVLVAMPTPVVRPIACMSCFNQSTCVWCLTGVTVWELGELYRGPFSSNYYSSRGCLYRHAYPVGALMDRLC